MAGQAMASGFTRPLIGYVQGNTQRWIDLTESAQIETWKERDAVVVQATLRDAGGADCVLRQEFSPGALAVTSEVTVNPAAG